MNRGENFQRFTGKDYINDCRVGGDEILNQLKGEIAAEMKVDEKPIEYLSGRLGSGVGIHRK